MTENTLLLIYCVLILLASLAGGLIPLLVKLTHQRMQLAISLVAGFMLGVAVLHLLPHALMVIPAGSAGRWVMIGILAMFFLERFFCFHHHDAPQENPPATEPQARGDEGPGHTHDHAHDHTHGQDGSYAHDDATPLAHAQEHRLGWGGAAVGLTIHSLIAGIALAASMRSGAFADTHAGGAWAGLAVFLVIVMHKPFDSLTLGTLMAAGGWKLAPRHLVNALFALAVPLGALLFKFGLADTHIQDSYAVGAAVAFSAGVFMVISLSDLLPELQFHHHDRSALSAVLLLGVAMAWAVSHLEAQTHRHDPGHTIQSPAWHHDHPDPQADHATEPPR